MDERPETWRSIPQRRRAEPLGDGGQVGVPLRELRDRSFERRLVERRDQPTVPCAVKPVDGNGSNGRPSAPRNQARAFSPSEGR